MIAAILAAALSAHPAIIAPPDRCPQPQAFHASAERSRLLRPQDQRGDSGAQTLKSLPPANMELAVERRVAGCAAPAIVREDVQGDGRFSRAR